MIGLSIAIGLRPLPALARIRTDRRLGTFADGRGIGVEVRGRIIARGFQVPSSRPTSSCKTTGFVPLIYR